jgi:hypothetical protein
VLVRQDLSPGQQVVQACHAVAEALSSFLPFPSPQPHLVVCGVTDEAALRRSLERAVAHGVRCHPFHEPDLGYQMTAWASEPVSGPTRKHFRRYRLLNPSVVCPGPRAAGDADGSRRVV